MVGFTFGCLFAMFFRLVSVDKLFESFDFGRKLCVFYLRICTWKYSWSINNVDHGDTWWKAYLLMQLFDWRSCCC